MAVQPTRTVDFDRANEVVQRFQKESTKWLYGLDDAARILSWAFFTLLPYTDKLSQSKRLRQPHIMFRGPTGTGKTDLVSACAMAIDAKFERIQGMPTYMPEDILGYETIVEGVDGTRTLQFKPGKLMAHIVLIDEDNRLSGKTKAAVLEGMEESSATLASDYSNLAEGKILPLFPLSCDFNDIEGPRFFMVICTENIFGEEEGTFANPVAQLDRTTLSINMMDPEDEADEMKIVAVDPEVAREAEVDWGTAWVQMGGERRRVKLFVMRSRYSGKPFVRAYAWERQEMFFDAHMHAFHYYGGVFRELVYDNLTLSVKQILRGGRRVEQERFVAFRSYYTYRARFCNPGQGHEKGGVEGIIGFARRNFLVPLPRVENFDQLNQLLVERCHAYGGHRIAGREDNLTVEERFEGERSRLLPLPDRPYENFKAVRVKVDRYCTVRIDRNRYSVPRAYVGRWVWAHIHCQKMVLYADERKVAQHDRVFSKNRWQIDPLHYLDLIGERVGSFESARAIVQWRARWPKDYDLLLQQLRSRQGHSRGTREFVRILGLHRDYEQTQVEQAIASVLEKHCPSYESIRLVIRLQESSPLVVQPLPAELLPGVTDRAVLMSDVKDFNALLTVGVS